MENGVSDQRLDGVHAVITGGGAGIGAAIAEVLAARGARADRDGITSRHPVAERQHERGGQKVAPEHLHPHAQPLGRILRVGLCQ